MFIQEFRHKSFISGSAQVKLPRRNLILDPRANFPYDAIFDCHYHDDGITVTLTVIRDSGDDDGIEYVFSMRVYNPANEAVPDFDSSIYTYSGHDNERAPYDTSVAIVHPSVKVIKNDAFIGCIKMKKCIIHEGVEKIENSAFGGCRSLETLFLPSSLKNIEENAFGHCKNIRILSFPTDIDISQIGRWIIADCDTFFQITHIPQYVWGNRRVNNDQVHQAIIDLYRNLPPLHSTCLDVNVSVQTIHDSIIVHGTQAASIIDHDGMTPLHILSLNPHATLGCIQECLDADMSAAFVGDSRGNTPLDYLMEHNLAGHTWVTLALCMHCEANSSMASKNVGDSNASTNKNKRKRIS